MKPTPEIEMAVYDAAGMIEDPFARESFIDWVFRDSPDAGKAMKDLFRMEGEADDWFKQVSEGHARLVAEIKADGGVVIPPGVLESTGELGFPESIARRFRVLRSLGEGGGGVVYLAEQSEPVRREVAIKVLHIGMDAPGFLAAFQREQQSLALMNHPNIAGILDAGTTDGGRPYLVMEFVDGEKITRFCDHHLLGIVERIGLFLQVCSAIQHAHQKGIIHRDIKPSNIIVSSVDSVSRPKVIDFGIAAATVAGGSIHETLPAAGTPAYMSPEQADASSGDVDTRSDVFSLGVLLYELLAGEVPWSPGGVSSVVECPSRHLATMDAAKLAGISAQRRLRPGTLTAALAGDLDAIVLKAVAHDRRDRYDTVNSLAADLRRHLSHQPVIAHPQGKRYLMGKFIRRNQVACVSGAAILVILMLAALLAFGSYLRERQARKDAERARAIAASMLRQSEIRETIATAAILLNQNRIREADALLQNTVISAPLSSFEPTLEAAGVFRFLGARSALRGEWEQAYRYFTLLVKSGRLIPAEEVAFNLDLLLVAPVQIETGNVGDYLALRQEMLMRLPLTSHPLTAEHMLKMVLLQPVDEATLARLEPFAEVLRQDFKRAEDGWFAMALALYEYRRGRYADAVSWCERCLNCGPEPFSRSTTANEIYAMTLQRLGRSEQARLRHADALGRIESFKSQPARQIDDSYDGTQGVESYDTKKGTWYAWAVARILSSEASEVLGHP